MISKDIFHVKEFSDDSAESRANRYLEKGWTLLSVGPKTSDISNGQMYYSTFYVVGATKEQYDAYLQEPKSSLI